MAVSLTSIMADIASVITWIFTQFSTVLDTITSNPLFWFPIVFMLGTTAIFTVIRIVRGFGVPGRRGRRRF